MSPGLLQIMNGFFFFFLLLFDFFFYIFFFFPCGFRYACGPPDLSN